MANKAISELPQAENVNNQDLFVLEQGGLAKKLTAETFITEQGIIGALAEALDGHGGIQSVTLSSVSGRIRTYLITFTDGSATTFQVYDGTSIDRISRTSSSGLDDVYTVFLSDGTTTFFTVHNGADGTVSEAMLNDALKNKAPVITETTESSAIANFTDGADDMVMHNVVAEINPVQSGSGDPSPSNIRPITGWTGCNVTRTGKNLLKAYEYSKTQNGITFEEFTDGSVRIYGTATGTTWLNTAATGATMTFPVKAGTYRSSGNTVGSANGLYVYFVKMKGGTTPYDYGSGATVAISEDDELYLQVQVTSGKTIDATIYPQLELGSTATAYEPYITPSTVSLSWQTEAGTVYGGTIDVATGLLTVDRAHISVASVANKLQDSNGYFWYTTASELSAPAINGLNAKLISDRFAPYGNVNQSSVEGSITFYANGIIRWKEQGAMTLVEYKAYLTNNPFVIVYELATPQTYQLTPQQLMTLLGTNNVWTDIANVSVTYPADTKMFIEKLTIPSEDDMVANQAITSGKYFMIGNSLYLALANIASGAQITIGTNAQRVSLADALNTINS